MYIRHVVVWCDISGKRPLRQVFVDNVIALKNPCNVVVSALGPEWREVWIRILL